MSEQPRRRIVRPPTPNDVRPDGRLAALRAHLTRALEEQERWARRMTRAFNAHTKVRHKIKRLMREISKQEGK